MSHQELLIAYDEALFDQVVRLHRALAGVATGGGGDTDEPRRVAAEHPATRAFRARIAGAPPSRRAARERARRELAALERGEAPAFLVDPARARAEPREEVLRKLDAGELPGSVAAIEVATRATLALHDPFQALCWLADPRRRVLVETYDGWPFERSGEPDPEIDALLFGTSPLEVDGVFVDAFRLPYASERRCRWHRVAALPRVEAFVRGLLARDPPDVADYRRFYRSLHALWFSLSDEARVPEGGALRWDHARFLARSAAYIERFARFLGQARRRRWAVVVYIE